VPRHLLAYFEGFEDGWYGITNTAIGLGVGLVWQELHASSGHPWYRGAYVLTIEPFSSIPSQGLWRRWRRLEAIGPLQPAILSPRSYGRCSMSR
jgi:hypothetical protein